MINKRIKFDNIQLQRGVMLVFETFEFLLLATGRDSLTFYSITSRRYFEGKLSDVRPVPAAPLDDTRQSSDESLLS